MSVVAQDPAVRDRGRILMAKIAVPAEDLLPGPIGYRTQVIDYDATKRRFYGSHELPTSYEEEPRSWRTGSANLVTDKRFHAQNVYALIMRTLSRFEFALGRRLGWSFGTHQLKVAPHGMFDANAFYSPAEEGLVFGYFKGRSGKMVHTCLSHDVIVHETTHALVDALRGRYLDPSNPDQAAFHEGFADVIALLSVFSLPEVVMHLLAPEAAGGKGTPLIRRSALTAEALCKSTLFGLAEEMGNEIEGLRGAALRQSTKLAADRTLIDTPEFLEPHRRGELFVAAVMNSFIHTWASRIERSGVPGQRQFPLARIVEDGSDLAQILATMWIRALDYMPPVHLEFGDALSAVLTADFEVRPDDSRYELRRHLLEQFAAYGIRPASRRRDPRGIWNPAPTDLSYDRVRFESMRSDKDEVFRFLWENRTALELRPGAYTEVLSVRPCIRTGGDGFVLRETVAEYYQVARLTPSELKRVGVKAPAAYLRALDELKKERFLARASRDEGDELGGQTADDIPESVTPLYGGGVLVFDEYGKLKYSINKDVFGPSQTARLRYLWDTGQLRVGQGSATYKAAKLSSLHRLRAIDARRSPAEGW
jgi:hypothetical protein